MTDDSSTPDAQADGGLSDAERHTLLTAGRIAGESAMVNQVLVDQLSEGADLISALLLIVMTDHDMDGDENRTLVYDDDHLYRTVNDAGNFWELHHG